MKAIKLTTDNKVIIIDVEEPVNQALTRNVEGFTESYDIASFPENKLRNVPCLNELRLICNSECYLIGLPFNKAATISTGRYDKKTGDLPLPYYYCMYGNAVILAGREGNFLGLSDEQVQALFEVLKRECPFLEVGYEEHI